MASVILFPHSQIDESSLKTIIARVGSLTIFQPWFLESPFKGSEQETLSSVSIKNPPETLKPKADFKRLMAEFKEWLSRNRDKGYAAFLSASRKAGPSEDTHWEIRRLIMKAGGPEDDGAQENQILKYHLVLHLASEFEENRLAAEQLLNLLKDQKSPLEGALEEAPAEPFFERTALMETQLRVDEYQLGRVIEAWFGLFGDMLAPDDVLITFDPQVVEYVISRFELGEKGLNLENNGEKDPMVATPDIRDTLELPKLKKGDEALNDPVKKGLSGRSIILMKV